MTPCALRSPSRLSMGCSVDNKAAELMRTEFPERTIAVMDTMTVTIALGFLTMEVADRLKCDEFYTFELSPVIGTHVGPGMIGLAHYVE